MKKLSLLLAILLIVSFGVSAAEADTSFDITTTITGFVGVKVGEPGETIGTFLQFDGFGPVESVAFSEGELTHNLEIYSVSNVPGNFSVTTTANPLRIGADGHVIPYTVTVDGSAAKSVGASGADITFIDSAQQSNGLTFVTKKFSVGVLSTDLQSAEAGSYNSNWLIEIKTHN